MYEEDAFLNLYVKMLLTCETEVVYLETSAKRFQVVFLDFCSLLRCCDLQVVLLLAAA